MPGGRLALFLALGLARRLASLRYGLLWVVASRIAPFHYILYIFFLAHRQARSSLSAQDMTLPLSVFSEVNAAYIRIFPLGSSASRLLAALLAGFARLRPLGLVSLCISLNFVSS